MKYSELVEGQEIMLDAGFTCVKEGRVIVHKDEHGFYFNCDDGRHYLDGQLDFDDHETLVGVMDVQ